MSKALVVTPDLETKIRTVDYDWKLSLTMEEEKIIELIQTKENLSDLTMTYTINKVPFIYQKLPLFYSYAHYSSSNEESARIYYELYKLGYKDETISNLTEKIRKVQGICYNTLDYDTRYKISKDGVLSIGINICTDNIAPDTENMYKRIYFNAVRDTANSVHLSDVVRDHARTLYPKIENLNSNKKTLAAGVLYLISRWQGERRTQKEIAQAMQISEVSIRNNYQKISDIMLSIKQASNNFYDIGSKPEKPIMSNIMDLMHTWDMEFCIE